MTRPRRASPPLAPPTTSRARPPPRKSARRRLIRAVLDGIVYLALATIGFGALFAVLSPIARFGTKPTSPVTIAPSVGNQGAIYRKTIDQERTHSDGALWMSDMCVAPATATASRLAVLSVAQVEGAVAEHGLEKAVEKVADAAHDALSSSFMPERFKDVNGYAYRAAMARVFLIRMEGCAVPPVVVDKVVLPLPIGGLEVDPPSVPVLPNAAIGAESSPPAATLASESLSLAGVIDATEAAENESLPPAEMPPLDRDRLAAPPALAGTSIPTPDMNSRSASIVAGAFIFCATTITLIALVLVAPNSVAAAPIPLQRLWRSDSGQLSDGPVANHAVTKTEPEDPFAAVLAQWEEEAVCAGEFDWRGMADVPESLDIRLNDYSKPAQDYFSMIGTAIRAGSRWIFPVRWADADNDTLVHISDRTQSLRVLDVLGDFPGRVLPMRAFPELGTHRGGERLVYPNDLLVATIPYRMALPYDMLDGREVFTLWSLQALTPRERDVAIFQLLDTALPVIAHLVDAGITHGRVPMVLVHPRDEMDAGAVHPGWSPFRVTLVEPVAEGEGYSLWTSLVVHTLMPLLSDRWFNKDWDAAFPLDESLRSKVFADATNGVDAPELKAVLAQLVATDVLDPARFWPAWDATVRVFYPILIGMAHGDVEECNDVSATYYDRLLALSQRDAVRDARLKDTSVIPSPALVNPYLKPLDRSLFPPSLSTSIASVTNSSDADTAPPSDPDLICSARTIQRFWDNISTPLDESYESPFTCSVRDRLVARLDSNRVITPGDVTPGDSKYLRLRTREYYRAPRGWILRIERMRKVGGGGGRKLAGAGL
ncbi:hypothetical protein AMAG_13156 [Allomyces macrogynus ATCC 38327]|uniref:Uncharacterized protein n=1 Tax=Allomyces macrogynus (strain ATCC 38327) TaxID=578462 RepID=A0A0L0SZN2_ALLM3|nr:hypothetical protein, variant [Allomyces macrogynus ATCC 38327]KNE67979.1 hypothetical protein AMAG_13156 [Allomyces macrogynus ATCC 38327]|eukprot:KNE67978.1 hypothetical protein, variant [Allomyces macrogynus ATCC 38327]